MKTEKNAGAPHKLNSAAHESLVEELKWKTIISKSALMIVYKAFKERFVDEY